jgi:hypothetical protein
MFILDVWLDGVVAGKQPLGRLGTEQAIELRTDPAFQSASVP